MRLTHDEYYLEILKILALRSTCIRRKVGAIIVDSEHKILGAGYNGVPRGMGHCFTHPCEGAKDKSGDTSRCLAVHAEVNAVLQCARIEDAYYLYVSVDPCFSCAKMIANTHIKEVVTSDTYIDKRGREILERAGIVIRNY